MIEILQAIFGIIAIIGAAAASFSRRPFDKLIAIGILTAGVIPFVVARGYIDVAIAVALIIPVSTIFVLLACRGRCA